MRKATLVAVAALAAVFVIFAPVIPNGTEIYPHYRTGNASPPVSVPAEFFASVHSSVSHYFTGVGLVLITWGSWNFALEFRT